LYAESPGNVSIFIEKNNSDRPPYSGKMGLDIQVIEYYKYQSSLVFVVHVCQKCKVDPDNRDSLRSPYPVERRYRLENEWFFTTSVRRFRVDFVRSAG